VVLAESDIRYLWTWVNEIKTRIIVLLKRQAAVASAVVWEPNYPTGLLFFSAFSAQKNKGAG